MPRRIIKGLTMGCFLLALCIGCGSSSAVDPPVAVAGVNSSDMKGLDFSSLTDAQVVLAASVLNQHPCGCGCGMTLGTCRRDDSTCSRSLALGNQVIPLIKQGKTPDQVRFALQTAPRNQPGQVKPAAANAAPQKYIEFTIPAGDAPFLGAENARITILHYLDYQ